MTLLKGLSRMNRFAQSSECLQNALLNWRDMKEIRLSPLCVVFFSKSNIYLGGIILCWQLNMKSNSFWINLKWNGRIHCWKMDYTARFILHNIFCQGISEFRREGISIFSCIICHLWIFSLTSFWVRRLGRIITVKVILNVKGEKKGISIIRTD